MIDKLLQVSDSFLYQWYFQRQLKIEVDCQLQRGQKLLEIEEFSGAVSGVQITKQFL